MLTLACLTLALAAADTPARAIAEPIPVLRSARPAVPAPPPPRIRREETATPAAAPAALSEPLAPLPPAAPAAVAAEPAPAPLPGSSTPSPSSSAATSAAPAPAAPPLLASSEAARPRLVLNRARTLFNALRAFDAGDFTTAESICVEVLKHYPGDTAAMTLAGAVFLKTGRPGEAVEIFEEYTRLFPLEAVAHFYKGLAYHLSGDRDRAVASYWAARLLDPTLEAARANLKQLTEAD